MTYLEVVVLVELLLEVAGRADEVARRAHRQGLCDDALLGLGLELGLGLRLRVRVRVKGEW